MKLPVDENLQPRLACDLADLFRESVHVGSGGLGGTSDSVIWECARAQGFAFPTKDKDFASLSLARGAPPKVILLQTGNCSAVKIIQIVRKSAVHFADFEEDAQRSLLVLR